MTNATNALIDELSGITDKNKYLILSGGSGVGKTFLASSIVENCLNPGFNSQGDLPDGKDKYDYEVEFVPIHPSFSYEDFVSDMKTNCLPRCSDEQTAAGITVKIRNTS